MRRAILLLTVAAALQGCSKDSGGGPLGIVMLDPNQHVAAAEPLFSKRDDNCASSPLFIMAATSQRGSFIPEAYPSKPKPDTCVSLAAKLRTFAPDDSKLEPPKNPTIDREGLQRNEMIDAMIAASDRKCGRYIDFLKAYDSNVNKILGTASVITAGTSPLVAGEATAKILAGISAMFSSTRETFNNVDFQREAIPIVAAAIEKLREKERRSILDYEQCPLPLYSTQSGFADTMNYHTSCSVVFGLAEASQDVQRANTPDIATMKQMMVDLAALRKTAAAFADTKPAATTPKGGKDKEADAGAGAAGGAGGAAGAGHPDAGAIPQQSTSDELDGVPSCPFAKPATPSGLTEQHKPKVKPAALVKKKKVVVPKKKAV